MPRVPKLRKVDIVTSVIILICIYTYIHICIKIY